MKLLRGFFKHFAHPAGFLGRIVAFRLDLSNRQVNEWTVTLLELQPWEHVLEVGFGSGLTLQTTARCVPQGFVAGVDLSETMYAIAQKRHAAAIGAGKVALYVAGMEALPFPDQHFDKVYAVQVINYLSDLLRGLKELYRVTKPGGRVALFFEDHAKFTRVKDLIDGIYQPYAEAEVVKLLEQAGFTRVRCESKTFIIKKMLYLGHVALGEK